MLQMQHRCVSLYERTIFATELNEIGPRHIGVYAA